MDVLIIEDDADTREMFERWFETCGLDDCNIIEISNGETAWRKIQTIIDPLLILLDWTLPGMDGIELCKRIRADRPREFAYIIFFSGRTSPEDEALALVAGANDYIRKPPEPNVLKARIVNGYVDIKATVKLLRDRLTGAWQKAEIERRAEMLMERSKKMGRSLSIILVDVDKFKEVNDTYGHATGDEVLTTVTNRIRHILKITDEIGRYGRGDEFLIVVPHCDAKEILGLGKRIVQRVAKNPVHILKVTPELMKQSETEPTNGTTEEKTETTERKKINVIEIKVTVSVGVATIDPTKDSFSLKELIERADQALYGSKNGGRNRATSFHTVRRKRM